jgi:hypothetical protein
VIVGRPLKKAFEDMIQKIRWLNNPVMLEDFRNANTIFGEDLGVLKWKTVPRKTKNQGQY